jgi:hypothetical protein
VDMQYGYVPLRMRWILCLVNPRIGLICLRMALQPKYFNHTVPNRLTLKSLRYRDALQMLGLRAVQVVDHVRSS